ncbi:MAG: anti-sigma factor [Burkholderiaceae bacterium]
MNAPDDTLLSAWLDDELPPEQRAEVETWLREHPEDAARVRLWALDADALRARLDTVLSEPVPQALAQVAWRKAPDSLPALRWQRWAAALAVFVLGGAVGAGLMWRLQPELPTLARAGEPAWVQRAAVAHAVYVPEVRHAVEVKAQEEHLSRWLTKRLTVPVKLFDLRAQGFELVGGRLLPDAAGPSAQLMYQALPDTATGADGKPLRVTVYLRKPDSNTPAAFRYERQGELGLFYWVEGESAEGGACGYALVGALPREKLLALAEAIFKQGLPTQ